METKGKQLPAHIHILLARDALVGLVIRRSSSRLVCTLGWNRATDEFSKGQWLKGRIDEYRCDISYDGLHFGYFVSKGRREEPVGGAWTAISRTPYLKALSIWSASYGRGHGGGLFLPDGTFWLAEQYRNQRGIWISEEVPFQRATPPMYESEGYWTPIYHLRLMRDGWVRENPAGHIRTPGLDIFSKNLGHGFTLRKLVHTGSFRQAPGGSSKFDSHELLDTRRGASNRYPSWEWAELDGERQVWVEAGCFYAAPISEQGLGSNKLLFDFNPMTFEPIAAPY